MEEETGAPVGEEVRVDEAPQEVTPEETREKPPSGYVPHGALAQERGERRKAEARLQETLDRLDQLEKRLAPAEPEPEWKDPVIDADAHRKWQEHQLAQRDRKIEAAMEQFQQRQEMEQRTAQLAAHEQQFIAQVPDYPRAVQHLTQARQRELAAQGMAPHEIQAEITGHARRIYDAAVAAGINPAQMYYTLATQYGYQRQAAAPDEGSQIAARAAAEAATRGLGNAGGAKQKGSVTLAQLSKMTGAEIEAAIQKDPKLKRLL